MSRSVHTATTTILAVVIILLAGATTLLGFFWNESRTELATLQEQEGSQEAEIQRLKDALAAYQTTVEEQADLIQDLLVQKEQAAAQAEPSPGTFAPFSGFGTTPPPARMPSPNIQRAFSLIYNGEREDIKAGIRYLLSEKELPEEDRTHLIDLLESLTENPDPEIRLAALEGMSRHVRLVERFLPRFFNELGSTDDQIRLAALRGLATVEFTPLPYPSAGNELVRILEWGSPDEQDLAISAVTNFRVTRAASALSDLIAGGPKATKIAASQAMLAFVQDSVSSGEEPMPEAVSAIGSMLADSDIDVRRVGLQHVRDSGRVDAFIDPLIPVLNDEEDAIRKMAVEALGETRDPRSQDAVLPLLIGRLDDPSEEIRRLAQYTLVSITRVTSLVNRQGWEAWLQSRTQSGDVPSTDPAYYPALD